MVLRQLTYRQKDNWAAAALYTGSPTFLSQPSLEHRPLSPWSQQRPEEPVTLIEQPGSSQRLPPPCAQQRPVEP